MKRFGYLVSTFVAASLALAACGTDTNGNNNVAGTPVGNVDAVPTATVVVDVLPTETVAIEPTMDVVTPTTAATTAPEAGETGTPVAQVEMQALTTSYRLSTILDADVQTLDEEDLGEIERLVVNRDGTIRYGILKTGEFLGMGGRSIFVPWQAFQPMVQANDDLAVVDDVELVLNTTEEALQGSPEVDMDTIDFATANWDEDMIAYWTGQNLSVPVTGPATVDQSFVFNSSFDDIDVVNVEDEELGEIEDFIVDPTSGQIRYAVFEMGGFLGVGERFVSIPWASLNWVQHDDDGEMEVLFNVDKEQLNAAPYFESWDDVDLTSDAFDAEWNTFWQGVENNVEDALDVTPAAP